MLQISAPVNLMQIAFFRLAALANCAQLTALAKVSFACASPACQKMHFKGLSGLGWPKVLNHCDPNVLPSQLKKCHKQCNYRFH